jgi:hypothetical protein
MNGESKTVFHALDLDRTLFDTSKLVQTLFEALRLEDVQLSEELLHVNQEHEGAGTSFFIFEYLEEKLGDDGLKNLIKSIQDAASPQEFLLPGAQERIAFSTSRPGWGVGIITYGEKTSQTIKLKIGGLDHLPALITDSPQKGALISSWQQEDESYRLPRVFGGGLVDMVVLDDDKKEAFELFPKQALGQWVTNASVGNDRTVGTLPDNVTKVPNLTASIDYLNNTL